MFFIHSLTEVIRSNPRANGVAIIVSNDYATTPGLDTLKGTHKDAERMEGAFKSLNITTYRASNTTKFQLGALLNEAAQCRGYPRESRCIAFVFSGHGLDSNQIYMQDGYPMNLMSEIIHPLLPLKAPHIVTIPKLFFIDACRGSRDITPVVVPRSAGGAVQEIHQKGGTDASLQVPPEGNFLVAFSTMPEYRSYEMKGEGGVWMTTLAEKLRTSQDYVEIILSDVRKELLEKYQSPGWTARMQQPETLSRLNEKVCLARDIKSIGGQAAFANGRTTGKGSASLPAHSYYKVLILFMSIALAVGPSFLTQPPATQKSPQHPGHFRGLLNQLFQGNKITSPAYTETSTVDEVNVVRFIGVVTFSHQGTPKRFTSRGVHTNKVSALESAAEQAYITIGTSAGSYSSS